MFLLILFGIAFIIILVLALSRSGKRADDGEETLTKIMETEKEKKEE